MRYCNLLRAAPHYRHDAFEAGLKAAGLTLAPHNVADVLVIWNRYGGWDRDAKVCEKRGGVVLVVENGYLGNEFAGDRWYAISRSQHNGAGAWPDGGPERWDSLGIDPAPWRDGREVVVLPQRGIGPPGVAMPAGWEAGVCSRLGAHRIKHRVRKHPGVGECIPLEQDLASASAVVTWGSGAAHKALLMGVPVVYDFPRWIGAGAGVALSDWLAGAALNRSDADRLAMFRRLAWAQWRLSEITNGEAFRWLLS